MKSSNARRRSSVPHCARPQVRGVCHVVLRVRRGLPWLRTPRTYRVLEQAFRRGKEKQGFALVQFSVQGDHVHLLIEAESKEELARGVQGLTIRIAKNLNRYWRRRGGSSLQAASTTRAITSVRTAGPCQKAGAKPRGRVSRVRTGPCGSPTASAKPGRCGAGPRRGGARA